MYGEAVLTSVESPTDNSAERNTTPGRRSRSLRRESGVGKGGDTASPIRTNESIFQGTFTSVTCGPCDEPCASRAVVAAAAAAAAGNSFDIALRVHSVTSTVNAVLSKAWRSLMRKKKNVEEPACAAWTGGFVRVAQADASSQRLTPAHDQFIIDDR